jgi:hypothetical protein
MLRLATKAHVDAFRELTSDDHPRLRAELETYWASLCDAHIPVINELIRRYLLLTYDHHAFTVSAWDVPIWYLECASVGRTATLLPYKRWDLKPQLISPGNGSSQSQVAREFEWATLAELARTTTNDATPGEFDLLDARSLMERGDYTGAVRRTVTAIEAVLEWAMRRALRQNYPDEEVEGRLAKTSNNFPERLRQWRQLANTDISQVLFDQLANTRALRHDIVHRGRRLDHGDRGIAQQAVDTGRWLYNKIENRQDRVAVRGEGNVLKSVGRVALAHRFPALIGDSSITLTLHDTGLRADD